MNRSLNELAQISAIVLDANTFREQGLPHDIDGEVHYFRSVDPVFWRTYDYCAAVTRLYSTYERFILSMVEAAVDWQLIHSPSALLGDCDFRARYEIGLAEILRRRDDPRFVDVDRSKLVKEAAALYVTNATDGVVLSAAPLFSTLPNLRLNDVVDLFRVVGIGDFTIWLRNSQQVQRICADEQFGLVNEIKDLVLRRNEAAHGNGLPQNIWGCNEIQARLKLIAALFNCIYEFCLAAVCAFETRDRCDQVLLGQVTHVWAKASAAELTSTGLLIQVDRPVIGVGAGSVIESVIDSIRIEGVDVLGIGGKPGLAVGIGAKALPAAGMKLFHGRCIRGFAALVES